MIDNQSIEARLYMSNFLNKRLQHENHSSV